MKKLLLTGLAITSLIAANLHAQPVAQNATFVISPEPNLYNNRLRYNGQLNNLVTGGAQPYQQFIPGSGDNITGMNAASTISPLGFFSFFMDQNEKQGTFDYRVIDANGAMSNEAIVTVIHGQEKG